LDPIVHLFAEIFPELLFPANPKYRARALNQLTSKSQFIPQRLFRAKTK